ncbi:XRE family transcriptional regulator [bacterium D16-51]|nr:XRE family transcriptional regulator [bacterium D16-59]RKI57063.1 XRE family transcriptional regulator [bacterium D16-51]
MFKHALARHIGTTPQNFNSKMKRESFTIRDLEDIAHVLDCTFERNFILPNGDKV